MKTVSASRQSVYSALDSEREYQVSRWNETTTESGGRHSLEEWFTYMVDYIREAQHAFSREASQDAKPKALNIMRKVTAMGVAAMEQHGAPRRAWTIGREEDRRPAQRRRDDRESTEDPDPEAILGREL